MSALPPFSIERRTHPQAKRQAHVIYNPTAGSGLVKKRVDIEEVRRRFLAHGWSIATIPTRAALDGAEAARVALSEGSDLVVAMGGDGTINEVIQTLANQPVPLGIIPTGTINILALELGLPSDPLVAVDMLTHSACQVMDLGLANGRYFAVMAGIGADARMIEATPKSLKRVSGTIAYWVATLRAFPSHKAVRARLTFENDAKTKRLRRFLYFLVVSNSALYAGGLLKFSPKADIHDGLLDVCLVPSRRWYKAMHHIVLSFVGRLSAVHDVENFKVAKLTIETARPVPYQLDGDNFGTTPLVITVAPGALRVVAPA